MSSQHKISDQESAELRHRLRSLRGERSQEEFARLVGLTRSALANYENGRTTPKPSILRQISQNLGISESVLLSGEVHTEFELNMLLTGRGILDKSQETHDEQAMIRALRAVEPLTVQLAVGALLKEIGESPSARAALGNYLGKTVATLDSIHRSGGEFNKGNTHEEQIEAERALFRAAHGMKP